MSASNCPPLHRSLRVSTLCLKGLNDFKWGFNEPRRICVFFFGSSRVSSSIFAPLTKIRLLDLRIGWHLFKKAVQRRMPPVDVAPMPSCANSQMIGAMRRTLNQGNEAEKTERQGMPGQAIA